MKQTLRMKDLKIQMLAGNKFEFFFCSEIRGDYNFSQFPMDNCQSLLDNAPLNALSKKELRVVLTWSGLTTTSEVSGVTNSYFNDKYRALSILSQITRSSSPTSSRICSTSVSGSLVLFSST